MKVLRDLRGQGYIFFIAALMVVLIGVVFVAPAILGGDDSVSNEAGLDSSVSDDLSVDAESAQEKEDDSDRQLEEVIEPSASSEPEPSPSPSQGPPVDSVEVVEAVEDATEIAFVKNGWEVINDTGLRMVVFNSATEEALNGSCTVVLTDSSGAQQSTTQPAQGVMEGGSSDSDFAGLPGCEVRIRADDLGEGDFKVFMRYVSSDRGITATSFEYDLELSTPE